jgi:purine-binding chemotaxis protein CheW
MMPIGKMVTGLTGQTRARQLLIFTFAGLTCALPLADIQEIAPMAQLSTPPGLPVLLDGFLNLRGVLVPVMRLERLFGFPPGRLNLETRLLILRTGLSLSVDAVRKIITEDSGPSSAATPGALFNDCCVGQIGFGDSAVHVLSTERLLMEQEKRTILCLQAEMQVRLEASLKTA